VCLDLNTPLGRPKLTWVGGIKRLMGEKGLMEEDRNDRINGRRR